MGLLDQKGRCGQLEQSELGLPQGDCPRPKGGLGVKQLVEFAWFLQ